MNEANHTPRQLIEFRLAQIGGVRERKYTELQRMQGELAKLDQEASELTTALNVLLRFEQNASLPKTEQAVSYRPSVGKSLTDNIKIVVGQFGPIGTGGILEKLKEAFPDLTVNTISATLNRLKNQGEVVSDNRLWSLMPKIETAPAPTGAAQSRSESDLIGDASSLF